MLVSRMMLGKFTGHLQLMLDFGMAYWASFFLALSKVDIV